MPTSAGYLSLLATGLVLSLSTACSASAEGEPPLASTSTTSSAGPSAQPSVTPEAEASPSEEETAQTEDPASESTPEETAASESNQENNQESDLEGQDTQALVDPPDAPAPDHGAHPDAADSQENAQESASLRDDNTQTLSEADEQPVLAQPAPEEQGPSAPVAEISQESTVHWESCEAAAAEGITNILEGTPGYRVELDPDANGIACEG